MQKHALDVIDFPAATATEALGLLTAERPDIFVSDLGMPGEDGFSVLRRIRALPDPDVARVRALALSASMRRPDEPIAFTSLDRRLSRRKAVRVRRHSH